MVGNEPTIILIINNREDGNSLSVMLSSIASEVILSDSGLEVRDKQMDLILLQHPDSFEIYQSLKADENTEDVPVIILTEQENILEKSAYFRGGVVDYLVSPIQEEELRAKCKIHLEYQLLKRNLRTTNERLEQESEQKQETQLALEKSEDRWQILFNSSFQFIGLFTPEGRFIESNQTANIFVGKTKDKLIGQFVWDTELLVDFPLAQQMLKDSFQKAAKGEISVIEMPIQGADGTILTVSGSLTPIRDKNGQVYQILGEARNISEQQAALRECKQLESSLKASQERLHDILNSTTASIFRMRLYSETHWEYDYYSAGSEQLLGYTSEELIADTMLWISRVNREDLNRIFTEAFPSIFQEIPYTFEYQFQHKNGQIIWIISTINSRWNEDLGCWIVTGINTDITKQKQLELSLKTTSRKLERILDSTSACIFSLRVYSREKWEYEYYSAGSEQLFGYTPEELVSNPNLWLSRVIEDREELLAEEFEQIFNEGSYEFEYRFHHKDGRIIWMMGAINSKWDAELNCWIVTGFNTNIDNRKKLEIALQESENKYRSLAENMVDGIYLVSADFQLLYLNPAVERIFARPKEFLIQDHPCAYFSCIHPEDVARVQQAFFSGNPLDNPLEVNYRIIRPSGEISYVRDAFHTIRDEAGEIQYYQGILTDITQQKETEIALQKSQEQLQLAIEYGGIGIWNWNYQAGVNYWNDNTYRLLGYQVGGVKPSTEACWQVIHPDDYQRIEAIIAAMLADRREFNIEYRVIWPDDTIHWLSDRGRGIYDEKGELIQIVGTSVDITRKKKDEEALKISEANLNNAQRIAHLGSWEFDPASEKINWSEEMFRIFGLNPQEGEPNYQEFLQLIIPSDRDLLVEKINNLLATGTPYEIEHGIICPDGSIRYLLGQGEAVKNEQGEIIKAIGTGIEITARKQVEIALEASERQLRQLTNAIPGAVYQYRIDRAGKAGFTFVSKGWEEIYGISVEDIREENRWDVVYDKDVQPFLDSIERSRQELSLFQLEYRIITPTGELKWLNARSIPNRGADGSTVWNGVVIDITERKLLEEELNRSQAFLESIYRGTDTPIFVMEVDSQGIPRYLDFNPACSAQSGVNAELFKGKTFADLTGFLEPDAMTRLQQLYQHCIETGELIQYEEKFRFYGQESWWLARVTPLKNTAGQVTRLVAMVLDITERKNLEITLNQLNEQLEARVQKRTQELALSEIRARVTFEQAAVGMVEADLRGCLIRINQKFCDIVGYSDRELIGRNFAEITHPDDLSRDQDHVRRLLAGEYSHFSMEKRYIRPDGISVWVNLTVALTYNLNNEPDYFIGVVQDISEKKQAEEALRQANAELEDRVQQRTEQFLKAAKAAEAANRAKSSFLANMSHELRTPLNAILGFSQLLVREPSLTTSQQQHLQIINRSGEHLLALINNVLEMSKIEAGQLTVDAIDFDLYDLLNTLEQMFRLKATIKGLQLNFIKANNVPQYLHTDSNKLRQILLNLLSNALKFTDQGSVTLRVTVDCNHLIFTVMDTGIGIEPGSVQKIFKALLNKG